MATEPLVRVVYNGQAYFVPNSLQHGCLPDAMCMDEPSGASKSARQDARHARNVTAAQPRRRRSVSMTAEVHDAKYEGKVNDTFVRSQMTRAERALPHERQGWCGTHNVLLCSVMMVTSAVIYLSGGTLKHLPTHVLDGVSSCAMRCRGSALSLIFWQT